MSLFYQHTLAAPVHFGGVGVHSGQDISVRLLPARAGGGVQFRRRDVTGRCDAVQAVAAAVSDTRMCTTLANADGVSVATVEHLLATFAGLGIDNAVVEVDGPEIPIMDGSCAPFVGLLDSVGRRRQEARRRYMEILETVSVSEDGRSARLVPLDGFEIRVAIDFTTSAIGRQQLDIAVDETAFRRELADARTFGFLHEVETLRSAGLARGGTLENVVVIEGDQVLNEGGLRRPDEFVRHKALDALGDLFLLGAPLLGRYEAECAGHSLNNALARKVMAEPTAWRWSWMRQPLAQAG